MGVYKTDSGWGFVVDLPRGRDGQRRQRRRQGFRTKREAVEALDRLRVDVHGRRPTGTLTVNQLAERWVAWLESNPDRQGATIAGYRTSLDHYILPAVGHRNVDDVTGYDLEQIYAAARKRGVSGRPLSERSVERIHQTASAMFKRGVKWRWVREDPTLAVDKPTPRAKAKQAWTVDQVRQFLTSISWRDDFALWYLAVVSGARVGELAALTWDKLDGDRLLISEAEKTHAPDGSKFPREPDHVTPDELRRIGRVGPVKNRRERLISLDPGTLAVLDGYRNIQNGWKDEWGWDVPWMFTWPYGARYKKGWIGRQLSDLLPDGVPQTSFHGLRHTAGTLLLQAGVDIPSVAKRLGHDPNVLLSTYAHVLDEMDRTSGQVMGQLVEGR